MEEVKIEQVKVVTKYKTSDGAVFDDKKEAEIREKYLEPKKQIKELKFINGAYYCGSQADFDLVVDYQAHYSPTYNYNTKQVEPRYEYKKAITKGRTGTFFVTNFATTDRTNTG